MISRREEVELRISVQDRLIQPAELGSRIYSQLISQLLA
jgi:hypothetical protein